MTGGGTSAAVSRGLVEERRRGRWAAVARGWRGELAGAPGKWCGGEVADDRTGAVSLREPDLPTTRVAPWMAPPVGAATAAGETREQSEGDG